MELICITDLKEIKQAIVSDGIHLSFVRATGKMWASSNKATSQDWIQFILAVLENGFQLLWKFYWRKEEKILEQQGKVKGLEISQEQILGDVHYSDPQNQSLYDEHTLSLCSTAALNVWDKSQETKREFNHILELNRIRENPLVTFTKIN